MSSSPSNIPSGRNRLIALGVAAGIVSIYTFVVYKMSVGPDLDELEKQTRALDLWNQRMQEQQDILLKHSQKEQPKD